MRRSSRQGAATRALLYGPSFFLVLTIYLTCKLKPERPFWNSYIFCLPLKSLVNLQSFPKTWLLLTTSKSFNFSCLGLPKVQLPFICLCNSNAYAPQAIRSYIDCLLQTEYKYLYLRYLRVKSSKLSVFFIKFIKFFIKFWYKTDNIRLISIFFTVSSSF